MKRIGLFLWVIGGLAFAEKSGDEFTFDMLRGAKWNLDKNISLKVGIAQGDILAIQNSKGKPGTIEVKSLKDFDAVVTFSLSRVLNGTGSEVGNSVIFDVANELGMHVSFRPKSRDEKTDPLAFYQSFKFLGSVSDFATRSFTYLPPIDGNQISWTTSPATDAGLTFVNDQNAKGLLSLPSTKGALQLTGRNIKTIRVQYDKLSSQDKPTLFELKGPFTVR